MTSLVEEWMVLGKKFSKRKECMTSVMFSFILPFLDIRWSIHVYNGFTTFGELQKDWCPSSFLFFRFSPFNCRWGQNSWPLFPKYFPAVLQSPGDLLTHYSVTVLDMSFPKQLPCNGKTKMRFNVLIQIWLSLPCMQTYSGTCLYSRCRAKHPITAV